MIEVIGFMGGLLLTIAAIIEGWDLWQKHKEKK